MYSFILSEKTIPDLGKFDAKIAQVVPEFAGILKNGNEVAILLTVEPTSEIIAAVEAVVPPIVIPQEVTPRQIRQALILAGVSLQQIEDALETLPEPTKSLAKVEWEYSNSFYRNRPLVEQVGVMLGWTSEQLDQLWVSANSIP